MPTIDISIILIMVAFAWHYALMCGYISDDHAAVAQRRDIIPDSEKVDRGESFWVKRFNDGIVMFYLTRFFWSIGCRRIPFVWHLFSWGLHIVNVYLLYLVLGNIVGYEIAMYASAFWGVNPMLNQSVVWISGRPYSIGMFLVLIAMIGWQEPLVFMPYYFLAVVTNISIVLTPILLLFVYPEAWQPKLYIAFMVVAAAPFLIWKFHKRFMGGLVIDRDNFRFSWRKLNTLARVCLYYVWTLFVPVRMGWYHQAGFAYNRSWEKFNYLTVCGYGLILSLLLIFQSAGLWFFLGILPNSNLYATNSFLQDRYLYFASVGIALIVAPYLSGYPWLFYVAMTFYITRTYMYSRALKNDESMYRENWRNHPKSDYAINNLSYFLIQKRRYDEARVVIEYGIHINPQNKMLWYNLGITHAAQGHLHNDEGKFRYLKAIDCWKECLRLEPRWSKPAEDLKKLISHLVEHKVLMLNKDDNSPNGVAISIPNIIGMKEAINERTGNKEAKVESTEASATEASS